MSSEGLTSKSDFDDYNHIILSKYLSKYYACDKML